jgi:hypothetical protein
VCTEQRQREDCQSDQQALATDAEQLAEPLCRRVGAMCEELADGSPQGRRSVGRVRCTIDMNHEGERTCARKVSRPSDDEIFRFGIEVFLAAC